MAQENEQPEDMELPKQLNASKADISKWYHNILFLADMVDIRYNIKGMNVWRPYGFKTMKAIKRFWDELFQSHGIEELYFPQIIPTEYCEQNPQWWEGFKHEGFKVIAGENNEIQGALRPTGEAAMYPMYALWVRTEADLPLRAYETVSSFRYETAHTRPLIRDREITLWHEIHTVHATKEDSMEEAKLHIEFYKQLWDFVAMAPLIVEKPAWEVFPGAVGGIEFYNITPNGKAMENGSVNILGQAYAKKFNIKFKDKQGEEKFAWQVCTGNGARLLAGTIIQHGDDKGLVLPPNIAPYQVVIVPIFTKETKDSVSKKVKDIEKTLQQNGIRVIADFTEESPGKKFYKWELKGVPLRIEIGPKDIQKEQVVLVKRNTGEKKFTPLANLAKQVSADLQKIQEELLQKAKDDVKKSVAFAKTIEEIGSVIDSEQCAQVNWCKEGSCYDKIKDIRDGAEVFGSDYYNKKQGTCVVCKKKTDNLAYIAKTY